jgi:hypothetical protein
VEADDAFDESAQHEHQQVAVADGLHDLGIAHHLALDEGTDNDGQEQVEPQEQGQSPQTGGEHQGNHQQGSERQPARAGQPPPMVGRVVRLVEPFVQGEGDQEENQDKKDLRELARPAWGGALLHI